MRHRTSSSGIVPPKTTLPISIYPNPTSNVITITTASNYQNIRLSVLTLQGSKVMATSNQKTIDINGIPTGTYLLKIEMDGKTTTKKMVKIK
jgi:hypothetical protein